jgi:SAM-dependent methyltransferase
MPGDAEMTAYYELGKEAGRLGDWGRLEFIRTMELLERFMPAPPAVLLDVGGAAGAYALTLARRGYEVRLVDPIALHVEQAVAAAAADPGAALDARVGDARDLPCDDAVADVLLMLGPLYHLTEVAERRRALAEALRVLRPGGLLAAAAISRFASTIDGLLRGFLREPAFEAIVERDVADGQHRNPDRVAEWFTTAYFHLPDELEREVAGAGFDVSALLAVEGLVGATAEAGGLDAWLDDPQRRPLLLRAIRRVEAEPSLLGASPHLLALATRP